MNRLTPSALALAACLAAGISATHVHAAAPAPMAAIPAYAMTEDSPGWETEMQDILWKLYRWLGGELSRAAFFGTDTGDLGTHMGYVSSMFYTTGFPSNMSNADISAALADVETAQNLLTLTDDIPIDLDPSDIADFQDTLEAMYGALAGGS